MTALTEQQVEALVGNWVYLVLLTDEQERSDLRFDAEHFKNLGAHLRSQRKELGRLLAQGTPDTS